MNTNWTAIFGDFTSENGKLEFIGGQEEYEKQQKVAAIGNFICNHYFGGGKISADVTFTNVSYPSILEIVFYFDPASGHIVTAGLGGGGSLYSIRSFTGSWTLHASAGNYATLTANRKYRVELELRGSIASLTVDGIVVIKTNLPYNLPISQVGLWAQSEYNIIV